MLQLPDVGKSRQIQGRTFSPIGPRIHGEHFEKTADQVARLTTGRSKLGTRPVPVQAESRIGVHRSEMSMI